jgi:hypothetical protein
MARGVRRPFLAPVLLTMLAMPVLATACSSNAAPGEISGHLRLVEGGLPTPPVAVGGTVLIQTRNHKVLQDAHVHPNQLFSFSLSVGTYVVGARVSGARCPSLNVNVVAGSHLRVTVRCLRETAAG